MNPKSRSIDLAMLRAPGGGSARRMVPGYLRVRQSLDNWCWAAVASAVDSAVGRRRTECEIAGAYGGYCFDDAVREVLTQPTCPPSARVDTIGYLNEVLDMLELSRGEYSAIVRDEEVAEKARGDIGAGLPVPVRIGWSEAGDGHFVSLIGTDRDGTTPMFVVHDPSANHADTGQMLVCSVAELARAYAGIGRWSHVYPVRRI